MVVVSSYPAWYDGPSMIRFGGYCWLHALVPSAAQKMVHEESRERYRNVDVNERTELSRRGNDTRRLVATLSGIWRCSALGGLPRWQAKEYSSRLPDAERRGA
jgi:hypothetical protein